MSFRVIVIRYISTPKKCENKTIPSVHLSPSASAHSPIPRLHAPRPKHFFSPPTPSPVPSAVPFHPCTVARRPDQAAGRCGLHPTPPPPCRAPPRPLLLLPFLSRAKSRQEHVAARARQGTAAAGEEQGAPTARLARVAEAVSCPRDTPPSDSAHLGSALWTWASSSSSSRGRGGRARFVARLAAVRRRRRQDPGAVHRPLLLFLFEAASICATAVTRGQHLPFSCSHRPSSVADLVSIFIPYSNPIYFFVSF
jgi:hypothetical protein